MSRQTRARQSLAQRLEQANAERRSKWGRIGYNDRTDWANLRATCSGPVATAPSGAWPHFIPSSQMTARASSANYWYPASNAIDGKLTTLWHSEFSGVHDPLPISLTIDTGATRTLTGLTYQGRLDGDMTGTITVQ